MKIPTRTFSIKFSNPFSNHRPFVPQHEKVFLPKPLPQPLCLPACLALLCPRPLATPLPSAVHTWLQGRLLSWVGVRPAILAYPHLLCFPPSLAQFTRNYQYVHNIYVFSTICNCLETSSLLYGTKWWSGLAEMEELWLIYLVYPTHYSLKYIWILQIHQLFT